MSPAQRPLRARLALGAAVLAAPAVLAGTAAGAVDGTPGDLQPLTVTAGPAAARYTQLHTWGVDKWAAPRAGWDAKDQSVAVDYTVRVRRRTRVTGVAASGTIVVTNPNPATPVAYTVADELPGAECAVSPAPGPDPAAAGTAVPAPAVLAGGAAATWLWECTFEELPEGVVYATVTVRFAPQTLAVAPAPTPDATALGFAVPPALPGTASTTVPVDFATAVPAVVNPAVSVTDTLDGDRTRVLREVLDAPRTFRYRRYLGFWRVHVRCRTWDNVVRVTPAAPASAREAGAAAAGWVRTATAGVTICPPPPKEAEGEKPAPPKVEVTGPGGTVPDPVPVTPADNPVAPVVPDDRSLGRLTVTAAADRARAAVGDRVTWRITVRNGGAAELYAVRLVTLLPRQLAPVPAETARRLRTAIGTLAPGAARVVTVATTVTGRPAATPAALARARRLPAGPQRRAALRRLRTGAVCAVATATARKASPDAGTACVRVVARTRPGS